MSKDIKDILDVVVPIVIGLSVVGLKQLYTYVKASSFNLSHHKIFASLEYILIHISTWRDCKENRYVFVDALEIMLRIFIDELRKFAVDINKKSMISRKELAVIYADMIFDIREKYAEKWEEKGIPDKVIAHIQKKELGIINMFMQEIEDTVNDRTIPKEYAKRELFNNLRILLIEYKVVWKDVVYRDVYNGYFRGVTYKDVPINDEEFEIYYVKKIGNEGYNK